jgi:hypothetical protein
MPSARRKDDGADERAVRGQIKSMDVFEAYPAEQILIKSAIDMGHDLVVRGAHEKGSATVFWVAWRKVYCGARAFRR